MKHIFSSFYVASLVLVVFSWMTIALDCTRTSLVASPIKSANTVTTTSYTITNYFTRYWNCSGCDHVVVIPFGHVWAAATRIVPYLTTVTAVEAWNITENLCLSSGSPYTLPAENSTPHDSTSQASETTATANGPSTDAVVSGPFPNSSTSPTSSWRAISHGWTPQHNATGWAGSANKKAVTSNADKAWIAAANGHEVDR